MNYSKPELWDRFQKYYSEFPKLGMGLDLSRMKFSEDFFSKMQLPLENAFSEMSQLEKGSIANADENRMVGHYWLRNPALAPNPKIREEIETTIGSIKDFAGAIHAGNVQGASGPFKNLLVVGIGGSALGPQFIAKALGYVRTDKMTTYFLDNTDPDGIDNILSELEGDLTQTLCIVISKSGGTKETRNGMLEVQAAYKAANVEFNRHAVAITSQNSELDKLAATQNWLRRFPMWDWVGGRTSVLSAVGLLPAALQGLDIDGLLKGARICDEITRLGELKSNPAAQLALMWFYAGEGRGTKNMIILPYKDRLELFSKYLQQLIMESLGKERDRSGQLVNQGITVLGNKGSTDQHSYVQQLREGLSNFFVTFIEVLRDRHGKSIEVEPNVTSGDFLEGFLLGTRGALFENGRESITITVGDVSAFTVGALIALFERTVGYYASLVNVNAYHQPGVEAGKKAAAQVISCQLKIQCFLASKAGHAATVSEIATGIQMPEDLETVFKICEHLAANPDRGISKLLGGKPSENKYRAAI